MRSGPVFAIAVAVVCSMHAAEFQQDFQVDRTGEAVAELNMRSPGSDWAVHGRESAIASVTVDGPEHQQHVILYGGPAVNTYRIFLGELAPGRHKLTIRRDERFSAPASELAIDAVRFTVHSPASPEGQAIASAPVLYARVNTIGKFSDVPTIVYAERLAGEDHRPVLQYTAIFSNEDGGTSTRALMARWGRSTDIEYMYRVSLDENGHPGKAIIQGPNHVDLEWSGPMEGSHPLLMPVTNNNTFGPARPAESPLRFQIAPIMADLTHASRESVMDQYPVTYDVMAKELRRENKLRPFGTVEGEKISDPRNYLYVDYGATHVKSAFTAVAKLTDGREFASDLGRLDLAIDRNGWLRTTVELPPGTKPSDITNLRFDCKSKPVDASGSCTLLGLTGAFLLGEDGRPGPTVISWPNERSVKTGEAINVPR